MSKPRKILPPPKLSILLHGRPEMEAVLIFVPHRGGIPDGYTNPHRNPAYTSQYDQANGHK
jgi:hypothetical protein